MPHDLPLISTIAMGLGLAFVCGMIASRLRLPPLVGYLIAGVVVGPFTPGFVANPHIAAELAEIGVILLMFGVGMHFSFRDLMAVKSIAIPGAIGQIAVATAMGVGMTRLLGWTLGGGIVFGLALSVASTVVLLRALEARNAVTSPDGRIAVGWLIVEDLATVLVLVLLPALAGAFHGNATADPAELAMAMGGTFLKIAIFIALMVFAGIRLLPRLLDRVAAGPWQELFTLSVLAIALGIAFGASKLFGVTFALGAFLAGVVVNASDHSHRAAEETRPISDAFGALFFVSVGMLFNPAILVEQPLAVLATVVIIIIGKSVVAYSILRLCRRPHGTALFVSASLAQIGEFSFILANLGLGLKLLPPEGNDLLMASALISITLNPLVFKLVERFGLTPFTLAERETVH